MKKTDGMRLRPTSRTYRHFRTAFVLSTRMATATLAGNRHRSIGTDRRRDKLMSEYAAEAARRDADQQKQARDMQNATRSEEHTSELQSLMRISYAVFCLKKKNKQRTENNNEINTRV